MGAVRAVQDRRVHHVVLVEARRRVGASSTSQNACFVEYHSPIVASRQRRFFMRRLLLIPALILSFALPPSATTYAAEVRCNPDGFARLQIESYKRITQNALDSGMAEDDLIDRINSNLRPKNENEANVAIKVARIVFNERRGPRPDATNTAYREVLKLCIEETAAGRV
jgi:hypothetical protein